MRIESKQNALFGRDHQQSLPLSFLAILPGLQFRLRLGSLVFVMGWVEHMALLRLDAFCKDTHIYRLGRFAHTGSPVQRLVHRHCGAAFAQRRFHFRCIKSQSTFILHRHCCHEQGGCQQGRRSCADYFGSGTYISSPLYLTRSYCRWLRRTFMEEWGLQGSGRDLAYSLAPPNRQLLPTINITFSTNKFSVHADFIILANHLRNQVNAVTREFIVANRSWHRPAVT